MSNLEMRLDGNTLIECIPTNLFPDIYISTDFDNCAPSESPSQSHIPSTSNLPSVSPSPSHMPSSSQAPSAATVAPVAPVAPVGPPWYDLYGLPPLV